MLKKIVKLWNVNKVYIRLISLLLKPYTKILYRSYAKCKTKVITLSHIKVTLIKSVNEWLEVMCVRVVMVVDNDGNGGELV